MLIQNISNAINGVSVCKWRDLSHYYTGFIYHVDPRNNVSSMESLILYKIKADTIISVKLFSLSNRICILRQKTCFSFARMFSMKTLNGVGEVLPHKTSLIPPRLIKMPVSSQERERSCICVLEVSILPLSSDFSIGFWNCFDSVEFCFVLFFICLLCIFFLSLFSLTLPFAKSTSLKCVSYIVI